MKKSEFDEPCVTCNGKKTVPDLSQGTAMCYTGPNGERWPEMLCPTCFGTGKKHLVILCECNCQRSNFESLV